KKAVVTGVEMFRKLLDEGQAGDNVGLLLRGVEKHEVERGMVLAKPGSITPHTAFDAEVYVLTKEEGGRHTPFFKGYRPQFRSEEGRGDGGRDVPQAAGRGAGGGQRRPAAARGGKARGRAGDGAREAGEHHAAYGVRRRSVCVDQGRGRPPHAVLQGVPAAV